MIYYVLETISAAIFGTLSTIWMIEETVINLMMMCSLMALRIACHPMMLLPMLLGSYYVIRKLWMRRRLSPVEGELVTGMRSMPRTPQTPPMASYRSMGSVSSRSNDSCEYEVSEEDSRRRS